MATLLNYLLKLIREGNLSTAKIGMIVNASLVNLGLTPLKLAVNLLIFNGMVAQDFTEDARALLAGGSAKSIARVLGFLGGLAPENFVTSYDTYMILYDEFDRSVNLIYPKSYSITQNKDNPNIIKWDVKARLIRDEINDTPTFSTLGYNFIDNISGFRTPEAEEMPSLGPSLAMRSIQSQLENTMERNARVKTSVDIQEEQDQGLNEIVFGDPEGRGTNGFGSAAVDNLTTTSVGSLS